MEIPASDMLYLDFDGDGQRELLVLSPFHGDALSIWKKTADKFSKVYEHPQKLPFIHAIWGEEVDGKVYGFVGCREGDRDLLAVSWNGSEEKWEISSLDAGAGAANVMYYKDGDKHCLLAANRETDEIAVYSLDNEVE